MTIICDTLHDLAIIAAQLTREGLAYTAHTATLTITITGY